jgi:hypothetical protein
MTFHMLLACESQFLLLAKKLEPLILWHYATSFSLLYMAHEDHALYAQANLVTLCASFAWTSILSYSFYIPMAFD